MWPGKLLSTTCCISNRRLFDDGTASEDGDVSLSVVGVVLVVHCNQLHIYWCSIYIYMQCDDVEHFKFDFLFSQVLIEGII